MFSSARRLSSVSFMGSLIFMTTNYDFSNMTSRNVNCFVVSFYEFFMNLIFHSRNLLVETTSEGNMRIKLEWCPHLRRSLKYLLPKRKIEIFIWAIWIYSELSALIIIQLSQEITMKKRRSVISFFLFLNTLFKFDMILTLD